MRTFLTFALILLTTVFGWSFLSGLENPLLGRPSDSAEAVAPTTPAGPAIEVEVLNGVGVSGLARQATCRLRDWYHDVVYIGNAPTFGPGPTRVIDRVGNPEQAAAIAAALGVQVEVESLPDSMLAVDVTVILGDDWPGHACRGGPSRRGSP